MKKYTLLILLFFALQSFSQKEANIWYFGENAGLDFNTNPPTALTGSLVTDEGSASISNSNGILQFYTDGSTAYDRSGAIMSNGTGLLGDSSSAQSAIIVPKPQDPNIYYLFTVGNQRNLASSGNGVHYSIVDMSLNGGFGAITTKNISLIGSELAREKITSVKGFDCDTFWVITSDQNNFYSYLVDNTGVINTPITSSHSFLSNLRGYLKLSPDGNTLVNASASAGSYIYDFYSLDGKISNEGSISILGGYGVEFSRDGKKLYISTGTYSQIRPSTGIRNPPELATITQYSLDSRNIIDINASRNIIYQINFGYRGALQLAPDGKIYYARSRETYLGVINYPEKNFIDVDFKEEGFSLNGQISTEGLPPFISSLLLPIKIIDNTGFPTNNVDLKTCIGSTKVITPEAITGITDDTYIWTFDNTTTVTEISNSPTQKSLNLSNIQIADTGTYKLKIEGKDGCGSPVQYNASFNLKVFEAASAKPIPDPIYFCDSDATVPNVFDFRKSSLSDKSKEILDGLSDTIFEVLYFDDPAKATDNVAGTNLPDDYEVNTPDEQTIYARVHNMSAPDTCYEITQFKLTVTGLPVAIDPGPYRACDTDISGPNFGYHDAFRLDTKDEAILGGPSGLDPTLYNISYHTTALGAKTSDVATIIPRDIPYRNITINKQEIFIRLENKADPACFDASMSFNLIVDPLPIIKNNPVTLEQCITTIDPNPTVNLTLSEINISDTPKLTFEYYEDPTGTTFITTPTSYPVIANTSQSVYVKVISDQGCSKDLVTLTINVGQTLDNPFNTLQPPVCDDFLDANGNNSATNSDTDFITNFSLDSISIVNNINPPINTKVFFYENQKDRTEAKNEIYITKYRNDISKIDITTIPEGIQFPIYYKILSTINNDCQGLGQFYLQVNSVPIANIPANFELCDDAISGNTTDGINTGINLRDKEEEILGRAQIGLGYTVTYHTSQADADDVTSTGIPNADVVNYTNTPQAGWSRGDISEETIYVRVQNLNGCINNPTSFKIIVNPIPSISTTITPFPVCDVVTPSDGDPRNRIAQNIDLTSKNDEILAGKPDHIVKYYLTKDDADNDNGIVNPTDFENDPLLTSFPANFNSDDPAIQTIFVKVFDLGGNKCSSVFSTFELVIYPEPNLPLNISDYSDCDNSTDIDELDDNGKIGNITLKNKIPEILVNYNPTEYADFSVRFYASEVLAELGDLATALDENIFENDANGQEIFVRVENIKNTPIICVNTRLSFKINIKPLPSFIVMGEENIDSPQIVCLNDTPLVLEAENPGAIYTYQWTDKSGVDLGNNATLGVTTAGNYTVTATDKVNGCSRSRTIVVKESNIATLEESFITIIDEANTIGNTNTISVSIDTISNNLGPGAYQYALRNEDTSNRYPFSGFQDTPVFENLEGGIYTIIVNDKNGCVPDAELQISVIQFPKFFTPNGDGKNDTWSIKGANKSFYPNSSIDIYNRFGKLVAQIPIDSQGWDGTYNGTRLPSDDYWFRVQLIPANTNKNPILKKGHFSLLRR
jgi:gliding motility-associated-like protein